MYQLTITDDRKQHLVVLTLPEQTVLHSAVDVIFDVLGADPEKTVEDGLLSEGQLDDLKIIQEAIFDRDDDGLFIRDGVHFLANGRELDPDSQLSRAFSQSERDGIRYMRCELVVLGVPFPSITVGGSDAPQSSGTTGGVTSGAPKSKEETIEDLSRVMFLHQISIGFAIDVTKDYPELMEVIAWAEKNELIEIDVKKAAYKLTAKGKRLHDSYIEEAQDLIKRFDIYGNVDGDNSGYYFDTGLGRDLRVPAFEMEGVDPFRARFLLGINDGEWDMLSNWSEVFRQQSWYDQVFAPIEQAPSIEEIGREKMAAIMTSAKAILRQEFQNQQNFKNQQGL
jgi:hypothetical protein